MDAESVDLKGLSCSTTSTHHINEKKVAACKISEIELRVLLDKISKYYSKY